MLCVINERFVLKEEDNFRSCSFLIGQYSCLVQESKKIRAIPAADIVKGFLQVFRLRMPELPAAKIFLHCAVKSFCSQLRFHVSHPFRGLKVGNEIIIEDIEFVGAQLDWLIV